LLIYVNLFLNNLFIIYEIYSIAKIFCTFPAYTKNNLIGVVLEVNIINWSTM